MFRRALRYVLASSLALALWTLASPAMAAPAPYCDDRGASGLAAPPALEAADVAVMRAHVAASCPEQDLFFGATLTHGRAPSAPIAVTAESALPATTPVLVAPAPGVQDPPPIVQAAPEGVDFRIERPPRV